MTALEGPWADLSEPQTITLPSGQKVSIVLPDLLMLAATGEIPATLLRWTEKWQTDDEDVKPNLGDDEQSGRERFEQMTDAEKAAYNDRTLQNLRMFRDVARLVVVDPKLDDAQWRCVPWADAFMLAQIGMRQIVSDHAGEPIRGLIDPDTFRELLREVAEHDSAADDLVAEKPAAKPRSRRARPRAGVAA